VVFVRGSWVVVAVVAFPTLMDAGWNQAGTRQADGVTFALAGVSVLALLGRRRWPLGVTVLCGAALTALYLRDHRGELLNLPTMVGLYSVALEGDRRRSIVVGAVAAAWFGGLAELVGDSVGSPMLEMLWPVVPLALGEAVRARHELAAQHEAEQERELRHRLESARVGIAREFHDVMAHTMAAVNVQMGVAVAAFDARPDTARTALLQARASAKEALQELRATVGLLRGSPPGDLPAAPAPRLADVEELAATARIAGVAVTIDDRTGGEPVSGAVQLAAYRIVQEGLTNVVRHARAAHAVVTLEVTGSDLVVEVRDDGTGPGSTNGAGHGLLGMTERAAALGGRLDHGPVARGGYRVRAVLPREVAVP
jgi:signal transduction histidine kinase